MRCNSRTVKPNPKSDEMKYKVSPLSSCLRFFEWGHLCSDRTQAFIITKGRTKTAKTGVNQIFYFIQVASFDEHSRSRRRGGSADQC